MVAEGDLVMERWTANATHLGTLMGIPPTGKPVSFAGVILYRFSDGKIVEMWWAWDTMGMMRQITQP
jgi:predicted ester cyclase